MGDACVVGREEGKLLAMRQLIAEGLRPPVLVFLQSKERAKELFHELVYDGINVDVIHAERTQEQRDAVIRQFRSGEIWVLICTDLMARGIDFKGVNMVINYDLPQSAVSYIHRIGRTGRAGRRGLAVTFFTEADMEALRSIANVVKLSGCEVRAAAQRDRQSLYCGEEGLSVVLMGGRWHVSGVYVWRRGMAGAGVDAVDQEAQAQGPAQARDGRAAEAPHLHGLGLRPQEAKPEAAAREEDQSGQGQRQGGQQLSAAEVVRQSSGGGAPR